MGKRKTQAASMGKTIIRDRFRGKRDRGQGGSYLHTADLNDGYDWGRLNLRSVTEQSNLEEFLMTAELANTEFVAEKLNVQIVSPQQTVGLLGKDEMQEVKAAQEKHKELLRIPRRPHWDENTTPEVLDKAEKESFVEWLHQLSKLKENKHVQLTPYEVNLEFWRQLWRVIEMSDVVVQIVDARNPLLFWCPDLDKYVKEVDGEKVTVILINKADYLTPNQRKAWADYFAEQGVQVVFFSALEETKKLEESKRQQKLFQSLSELERTGGTAGAEKENEDEVEGNDEEDEDDEEEGHDEDDNDAEEEDELSQSDSDTKVSSSSRMQVSSPQNMEQSVESQTGPSPEPAADPNVDYSEMSADAVPEASTSLDRDSASEQKSDAVPEEAVVSAAGGDGRTDVKDDAGQMSENSSQQADACDDDDVNAESKKPSNDGSCPLQTTEELLKMFRSMAQTQYRPGVTTVGMVGYPNVGKSSTINAILKTKKVPVSATPGRTKTYQTAYVDKDLMLCDCPGLVFPSFVDTKADQVVNGILSIDQLRDHITPISLVCERIPRDVLESMYGINLPQPAEWEDPNRLPTAHELLNTYGYVRGYMTQSGNPDCPRTARYILKDYVNGKLLYCNPPPGIDAEAFHSPPYTEARPVHKRKIVDKPQSSAKSSASRFDKEFFAKMSMRPHTRGPRSISNYVRSEGLHQVGSTGQGEGQVSSPSTPHGSQQSIAGKPWKRHNNRNKKEKLRRVYADHDKY